MQTNPKGNYQILVRYLLCKGGGKKKKSYFRQNPKHYLKANLSHLTATES